MAGPARPPADDAAGMGVDDEGHADEAAPGRDTDEAGDPVSTVGWKEGYLRVWPEALPPAFHAHTSSKLRIHCQKRNTSTAQKDWS